MNPVEQLHNEFVTIGKFLMGHNEISMYNDLNKNFRKTLLLAAGSYFENKLTNLLVEFARQKSNGNILLANFLEKQAISKRYHTLFAWGATDDPSNPGKNAKQFFKLFGDEFSQSIEVQLKQKAGETNEDKVSRERVDQAIKAFIEIGHLRNILVHSNFAAYNYEQKTTDEIFVLFKNAEPFIEYVSVKLEVA